MEENPFLTWLEIDLAAVLANTRTLLDRCGVALMAVVKDNAYGLGIVEIAKAALAGGASYLAVARGSEAITLRQSGIESPILLFGFPAPGELDELISAGITLTLTGFETADMVAQRADTLDRPVHVHLKVDTGMGRFGVMADETAYLADYTLRSGRLEIEGVYTHFAVIDSSPDDPFNRLQLSRFHQALEALKTTGVQPRWIHAANSAAALAHPEVRFNMVRAGSAILGINPFYDQPFPTYLHRVLTWKAQLVSCRLLPPGWGISYGQVYHTSGEERIGVIPVGYADGFRRSPANEVLLDGKRLPVVGRVCADMSMVHLPGILPFGSEVVILGWQGGQSIQIEDLAERWQVSRADVTANINLRIPRIFMNTGY
jgi:alanine racemase